MQHVTEMLKYTQLNIAYNLELSSHSADPDLITNRRSKIIQRGYDIGLIETTGNV